MWVPTLRAAGDAWRRLRQNLQSPAFGNGGAALRRLKLNLRLRAFPARSAPRRWWFAAGAALGAVTLSSVAAVLLLQPRLPAPPPPAPAQGPIGEIARQATQVADKVVSTLPAVVPTPDPLADCQHAPANLPP